MRISNHELVMRRADRNTTFLLTGGTGFIGGHLAAELLKQGHRLILLARSSKNMSATQRVRQALDCFNLEPHHLHRLRIIEGSLDSPRFGLGNEAFDRLLRDVDEVIHCASDTSFLERKRGSVEKANITGMKNMLDLAIEGHCYFFHYISTVFAAGKKTGICREELDGNANFTNVYEETKYRAERMAAEACRKNGLRLSIYRPSIVYGDSKTGRSTRFNAVYYPVKMIFLLKNLFEEDIRERGGNNASEMGVRLTDDGSLYLPIRVEVVHNGGINLIPVDHFVSAFTALLEECLYGGIFHIVNRTSTRIEDLIDYIKKLFNVIGIEPHQIESCGMKTRNSLETLFDTYIDIYGPYIRDTRTFDNRNAQAILSRKGVVCPDFDYEVFSRCMNYAIACGWGANKNE